MIFFYLPHLVGGILIASGALAFLLGAMLEDTTVMLVGAVFAGAGLLVLWRIEVFGG